MITVSIHKAKTQLSRLVDEAASGKPIIIARAGKPMVKVTALDTPAGKQVRRLGFLPARFPYPMTLTLWVALKSSGLFQGEE